MNDVERARIEVRKELYIKKVDEDAKRGAIIKAERAKELGYKDKADQADTWIPTGPAGTPGGSAAGGYWRKAGFEDDEDEEGSV